MQDFLGIQGKKIVVTGASVGIGLKTAQLLSEQGAILILLARDSEKLENAKHTLLGDGHKTLSVDLNDSTQIEPSIKQLVAEIGPLDGLVHAAGIRSRRPLKMLKPVNVTEVLNVNLISFIELCRCLTIKGHFNAGMNIVGVSSIAAQRGGAGVTAYAASKAGMDAAVRCLAVELATKHIRINTVCPAQINTPAFEALTSSNNGESDKTLLRQILGLGEPEHVASTIAFLLSRQSGFTTGASIPVDGGYLSS